MRYFHDLGVNADLILMSDDGVGGSKQFHPKADTWNFVKYKDNIKYLNAPNRVVSILGNSFPWNIYFFGLNILYIFFNRKKHNYFSSDKSKENKKNYFRI